MRSAVESSTAFLHTSCPKPEAIRSARAETISFAGQAYLQESLLHLFLRPDPRNEERHLSTISPIFLAENAFEIPRLAHRHNPVERHRIEQGRHGEHS